jgi:hypothetical protein
MRTPTWNACRLSGCGRCRPGAKLALMAEMTESVRTLALAGLRQRYPTDTPAHRRRRLDDLLLGPELAARAYGPLPPPEEG